MQKDCSVIGTTAQEPLGDRAGHVLASFLYSCFGVDGLLKGAVVTAINASEWDGPKGMQLAAVGIHRAPGGEAVDELLEGTGAVVMRESDSRRNLHVGRAGRRDPPTFASTRPSRTQGTYLVRLAKSEGADLIVTGGYGHSRLGEWMFGGMTRGLLQQVPICLLMSH
ncbi:nucleotide-binding universal stress UspA family protein [Bradyrhizobium elkanii]